MDNLGIKTQAFLANLPVFREMAPRELGRVAAATKELRVARGEVLFRKGDPCTGFHAVIYGQVKIAFISPQGAEKVIEIIGPGMSFGEAIMFMDKPYIVFAQTLADSMLLHVSKTAVYQELDRDPRFARKMIAGLSRRLHGLVNDLEANSLRSGAQRVVGYLLRGDNDAEQSTGETKVTLATSKVVIASRLNLTPEHFSRILHELMEARLITVRGRDVIIHDVEKLQSYGL